MRQIAMCAALTATAATTSADPGDKHVQYPSPPGLAPVFSAPRWRWPPRAAVAAYPDKPIRLVVPFAPGGGTDLIARTLGAGMSNELGQQVIIDNKPGAGTIIGTDAVAKSPPDGYTIVIATFAHAVNPEPACRSCPTRTTRPSRRSR